MKGVSWPRKNCLAFSSGCFRKTAKRDHLVAAIKELYWEIGKVLSDLAKTPQGQAQAVPLYWHLVRMLVTNEIGDNESRWSFVTEEEDLALLLREDDTAWPDHSAV